VSTDTPAEGEPTPAAAEPSVPESTEPSAERVSRPLATVGALVRSPLRTGFLLTLGGLLAFALGTAATGLSTVFVYLVFALFIALGLDPLVRRLERLGLTRGRGILVVCGAFLLLAAGIILLIVPTVIAQIADFFAKLPQTIADFQTSDLYAWAEETFGGQVDDIVAQVQGFLLDPNNIAAIGGGVLQVGTTIAAGASGLLIVVVLSLYLLASLTPTKASLLRLAPAHNRPTISEMTDKITASVGSYLGGMVVLAFLNAVFTLIMHLVLGLPFPQLLAVGAFCITLIPMIGSVVFWVIASSLALFASPVSALVFAIAYLVYMQVEAYLLTPRVMGRAISIPPILVMVSTLIGGTLLGLLGALIAIPVTASILLIIRQTVIPRQDAKV